MYTSKELRTSHCRARWCCAGAYPYSNVCFAWIWALCSTGETKCLDLILRLSPFVSDVCILVSMQNGLEYTTVEQSGVVLEPIYRCLFQGKPIAFCYRMAI